MLRLIIDVADVEGRGCGVEDGGGESVRVEVVCVTRPTPAEPGILEQGRTEVDLVLILGLGRSDGLADDVEAVVDVVVVVVVVVESGVEVVLLMPILFRIFAFLPGAGVLLELLLG